MFSHLNKEQKEAVMLPLNENALILAGAGSGKTRALTFRIAYLLKSGVPANNILAVTFTNKAAKEMLNRLTEMLAEDAKNLWVGTFHGIANRLLRANFRSAYLPRDFQIMDTDDQVAFIKRLLKQHFPTLIEEERESDGQNVLQPKNIANWIAHQKEHAWRARDLQKESDGFSPNQATLVQIYETYERECNAQGVVDFAELLLRIYEVFKFNDELRARYQQRFRYILVDEFQDINSLQFKLIMLLAKGNGAQNRVFVVGDDDQSIYGFRGADIQFLHDFERTFKPRIVHLGRNYRSTANILEVANAVIANNRDRFMEKHLWTESDGGAMVQIHSAYDAAQEARYVIARIQKLHNELGVPFSKIAVLYRVNALSRVLETEFIAAQIKYHIYGGLGFFSREEVKHVLAYMRLIANPNDNAAFLRVINIPRRGIGQKSLESLEEYANLDERSLYDTALRLNPAAQKKFLPFLHLIDSLTAFSAEHNLFETTQKIIELAQLRDYYEKKEKDAEKLEDRLENLSELLNATHNFMADETLDKTGGELSAFLSYAALFASEHQNSTDDAVQLMSVHLSKGLEFDSVFVVGLENGLFPHAMAKRARSKREGDELSEERRLLYVAMTRAQKHLHLSFARRRQVFSVWETQLPSQFLDEIKAARPDILRETKAERPQYEMDTRINFESFGNAFDDDKIGGAKTTPQTKISGRSRHGEALNLKDFVVHPKWGRGQIIAFLEGKGLGFVKLYFEADCVYKDLDLNVADIQKE